MARGWESKSVESQQHEAVVVGEVRAISREEREREAKRDSLQLSRNRVARELAAASTDAHRAALEHALQFLDEELRKV